MNPFCTIYILDADEACRGVLEGILEQTTARVVSFPTIAAFKRHSAVDRPSCLILETHLPDGSGLDLQRDLVDAGVALPIVFLSETNDAPLAVTAIKGGAADYLVKPAHADTLLHAVHEALRQVSARATASGAPDDTNSRFAELTARELEVTTLVASGLFNKEVAFKLGISELTVKVHRRRVMKKTGAKSVVDLVRKFDRYRR